MPRFTLLFAYLLLTTPAFAGEPLSFEEHPDRVELRWGDKPFATYVYRDEQILRPYFANVRTRAGVRVTRSLPPSAEQGESTDHGTMHPGLWLAFGDISGADFWRNKGTVEHVEFIDAPQITGDAVWFTVRNRYRSSDRTILEEVCRHVITSRPDGVLLTYDSTFTAAEGGAVFGDQEEFGLGIRMAENLKADGGSGRILNADGQVNGEAVRGTNARWCDYSGVVDGNRVGILLMPHPENFRPSWYHARDYGLLVANPFGRNGLTGGEPSRVEVKAGENLRLRFGVLIYATPSEEDIDRNAVYEAYTTPRRAE